MCWLQIFTVHLPSATSFGRCHHNELFQFHLHYEQVFYNDIIEDPVANICDFGLWRPDWLVQPHNHIALHQFNFHFQSKILVDPHFHNHWCLYSGTSSNPIHGLRFEFTVQVCHRPVLLVHLQLQHKLISQENQARLQSLHWMQWTGQYAEMTRVTDFSCRRRGILPLGHWVWIVRICTDLNAWSVLTSSRRLACHALLAVFTPRNRFLVGTRRLWKSHCHLKSAQCVRLLEIVQGSECLDSINDSRFIWIGVFETWENGTSCSMLWFQWVLLHGRVGTGRRLMSNVFKNQWIGSESNAFMVWRVDIG